MNDPSVGAGASAPAADEPATATVSPEAVVAEPEAVVAEPEAVGDEPEAVVDKLETPGRKKRLLRRKKQRRPLFPPAKTRWGRMGREVGFVVVAAIVLSFLLKTFLLQTFFIPSESMETTLLIDDRIIVSKLAPGPLKVHRGDIVVFRDPGGWLPRSVTEENANSGSAFHRALQAVGLAPASDESYLVKRVIGTGGDTVECEIKLDPAIPEGAPIPTGVMKVNGVEIEETYLDEDTIPCTEALEFTVPADALWVMGDNRQHSGDSRAHENDPNLHGAIGLKDVVGVAKLRMWPLSRWGVLSNPGKVFASVPEPG
ncbi:MAG: signal peptidase I [Micrococcales bacterium]|nr:signal peptidase I [Micrococcales bacterium]